MFDRLARKYDVANRAISMGCDRSWRRTAVNFLNPVAGGRYLDVGTGTGSLAFKILQRCPEARVDGVDRSRKMLAVARQKAMRSGVAKALSFRQADAVSLPQEEACYDGIISGFCFRNIENRQQALKEMLRVLKPGGRLVLLEAVYPERAWVRLGYKLYTPFIPLMGLCFGDFSAFRYLVESIEDFPHMARVAEMCCDAGVSSVQYFPMTLGAVCVFSGEKPLG